MLKITSFGMLNVDRGGIKISDPVTGFYDHFRKLEDLSHDYT